MTDRDTFAAAALAGLLDKSDAANPENIAAWWPEVACAAAYRWADAMLAFRDSRNAKTNHDAAPAARASVESVASQPTTRGDSARTDTAAPRPSEGTGDISEAQNDAIGPQSAAKTDTTQPRNGAPSGGPDPDSRVWETQRTPHPHATPPQGSVPGEGGVPRSGTENEPVAWWLRGTEYDTGCEYEYVSLVRESADAAAKEGGTVTPLYRAPTLTDEEREAVEWAADNLDACGHGSATLRKLLERMS